MGITDGPIKYWTEHNVRTHGGAMYTGNPDVPDDVFRDVLKQVSEFVRERVVPRELEILKEDRIPDDLRAQVADMGLFDNGN